MQYVIIGAGPAGVIAAETIRAADSSGHVVLIGGEPEPPYARMAIPYYLTGMVDETGTYLRKTAGHYDDLHITYVQGWADRVEPDKRQVVLKNGNTFGYDRLLIATGASAVRPPIVGLDLPGVSNCWTLEDARLIAARAQPGASVVLVGAGFIGCIILEALAERGVNLTVIEMADRMVPRMMNATAGGMIARWCGRKGIDVHLNTGLARIEETGADDRPLRLITDTGEERDAALVVVATGVKANIDFLEGSGIATDDGVLADEHMRTSVDGVFAAGDVCQGPVFSSGLRLVHAIQPTAADHGRIAGLNMAGKQAVYKGSLNMNVLDTVGLVSASFGQWQGVEGGDAAEAADENAFKYIRLAFDDDRLIGAISIGRTEHVGVLRGLIQTGTRLGEWKRRLMEDPHRIMEAYVALSQGHSPAVARVAGGAA